MGCDPLIDAIQGFPFAHFIRRACPLCPPDGDPVALGNALYGLGKSQVIVLH